MITNMNNSSFGSYADQSTSEIISKALNGAISTVSIAAFCGNILVTITFLMDANLRISVNYFIVNMAVSDLLASLTNWPLYAAEGMFSNKHLMGRSMATFLCKLGMYSRTVSQAVSILSLVLIVVDRYIAIVLPFHAIKVTSQLRTVLMLFTWIISLSAAYPFYRFSKITEEISHQRFCRHIWYKMGLATYQCLGFVFFYCAPLVSIIILYTRIMKCLTGTRPGNETRHNITETNRQQNQSVMNVFIWIVIVFFICWTPLCVYLLLKMIYPSLFTSINTRMIFAGFSFYIFPSLSTAINPVILFVSSSRFSKALKKMFNCFTSKPPPCCKGGRLSPRRDAIRPLLIRLTQLRFRLVAVAPNIGIRNSTV